MSLPKEYRGKYVTRAAYAKLQAEKQRIFNDLKKIVKGGFEGIKVREKWLNEFKKQEAFNHAITEVLRKESKKYRDLGESKIDSNPKSFK